jgi:hypothetical protein
MNAGKRCDCEHGRSKELCNHIPGVCNGNATITVRHFGLRQNLCQVCFDATCNDVVYPLDDKLKAEFEVLLKGGN